MNIFLQGPRNIGKSTVILKTLEIIMTGKSLTLGGFFTWNGGKTDPHVYMRPAHSNADAEVYRLASYDAEKGGLICNTQAFEEDGVRLLSGSKCADLIVMDELGFLESSASAFRQAVLDVLSSDIPVLGAIRLGDVPWLEGIRRDPTVSLFDVDEKTRGILPRELAAALSAVIIRLKHHYFR